MSVQELECLTCVKQQIADDKQARDLVWSLFVAALQSYRFDTVLRPFPSPFIDADGEKDVKSLVSICKALHKLTLNNNGKKVDC